MPPLPYRRYEARPINELLVGVPKGLYDAPAFDFQAKYDDALKTKQDIESTQQNMESQAMRNQITAMDLEKRQRSAEQEKAMADQLAAQFGSAAPGQFNEDEALATIKRLAYQAGDRTAILEIERIENSRRDPRAGMGPLTQVQRDFFAPVLGGQIPDSVTQEDLLLREKLQASQRRATDELLTPQEAAYYGVDVGTTKESLRLRQGQQRLNLQTSYQEGIDRRYDDPVRKNLRELNAILTYQKATGTQVKQPAPAQIDQIVGMLDIQGTLEDVANRYFPELPEDRAIRWSEAKVNPNSAIARLVNEINLVTYALAAAFNGKRISESDYTYMAPLVTPQPLDTLATIQDKFLRVSEYANRRNLNFTNVLEGLGYNLQEFGSGRNIAPTADLSGVSPPELSASVERLAASPTPTPTGPGAPVPQAGQDPAYLAMVEEERAKILAARGMR